MVAKVATKLKFLVAKLKVLVALATVSVAILSPVYVVERLSDLVSIWLTDKLTDWWADLLIEWPYDGLTNWLTDWLTNFLMNSCLHVVQRLTTNSVGLCTDKLNEQLWNIISYWLAEWLTTDQLNLLLAGWLTDWLTDNWSTKSFTGWLTDRLVGRITDWLAGTQQSDLNLQTLWLTYWPVDVIKASSVVLFVKITHQTVNGFPDCENVK